MMKLKAHVESGHIVLDDPIPFPLSGKTLYVLIEEETPNPRPLEIAQASSGFIQEIILNESEDVWEND